MVSCLIQTDDPPVHYNVIEPIANLCPSDQASSLIATPYPEWN